MGEADPSQSDEATADRGTDKTADSSGRRTAEGRESASEWFARESVRFGLVIVGLVLLLFALGQAFGFDLLGALADAVATQTGRWLVVALFALLLIFAALRAFRSP